jgi:hypothetical protein
VLEGRNGCPRRVGGLEKILYSIPSKCAYDNIAGFFELPDSWIFECVRSKVETASP